MKFSGANPSSTPAELVYQLKLTEATMIIAHSLTLETALKAAKLAGLPSDRVIILDLNPSLNVISAATLISDSISRGSKFVKKQLGPGEGKTKIAALCLSSGTTGLPKVSWWIARISCPGSDKCEGGRHKSFGSYRQSCTSQTL
jgi:long-subunit acyl-CoA synthetase (AMP-forming)